jgi:hypothetical protein
LIIEDERDVVDFLALSLRKAGGFVVSTAVFPTHFSEAKAIFYLPS